MDSKLDFFFSEIADAVSSIPADSEKQALCALISDRLENDDIRNLFSTLCTDPRRVVFEDPKSGICVVAHLFEGAKNGLPHDHGSTWSIYAQVSGVTEMTHYRVVSPPHGETPGVVEPESEVSLTPSDSFLYDVGEVHSPSRTATTRLLRIEGVNMDGMERKRYVIGDCESKNKQ